MVLVMMSIPWHMMDVDDWSGIRLIVRNKVQMYGNLVTFLDHYWT